MGKKIQHKINFLITSGQGTPARIKPQNDMKTQIQNLINGAKNIIRQEGHEKYLTAKPATSHNGWAGTNRDERAKIAAKVHEENPDGMTIEAAGQRIKLRIFESCSQKSWLWAAELNEEQYKALGGTYTEGNHKMYLLHINMDCTVQLYSLTKTIAIAQWRQSNETYIDEAFITIL